MQYWMPEAMTGLQRCAGFAWHSLEGPLRFQTAGIPVFGLSMGRASIIHGRTQVSAMHSARLTGNLSLAIMLPISEGWLRRPSCV